jgi:tRNA nucleotidyltransferase/poly(A) polymerase
VVSAERIGAEISKMLLDPNRRRAVQLLLETSLLTQPPLFPELDFVSSTAPLQWQLILDRLDGLRDPELPECLTALLGDGLDEQGYRAVCQRLRFSNEIRDTVIWLQRHRPTLMRADQLPWSKVQPLLVDPRIQNGLRLIAAEPSQVERRNKALALIEEKRTLPREVLDPPALIGGQALLSLGMTPGPLFAQVLQEIRSRQLDGELDSVGAALEFARTFSPGDKTTGIE